MIYYIGNFNNSSSNSFNQQNKNMEKIQNPIINSNNHLNGNLGPLNVIPIKNQNRVAINKFNKNDINDNVKNNNKVNKDLKENIDDIEHKRKKLNRKNDIHMNNPYIIQGKVNNHSNIPDQDQNFKQKSMELKYSQISKSLHSMISDVVFDDQNINNIKGNKIKY